MILWITFVLCFLAQILQCLYPLPFTLFPFLPFIALTIMKKKLKVALYLSALAGCVTDLLSSDPIGVSALNYTFLAALFYRFKSLFSEEEPLHLSLFTAFLSFSCTLFQFFLLFLFDRRVPFSGKWILADWIGMPVLDALYAFIWVAAPLSLVNYLRRMWMIFWLKRKRRFPKSP